jgi:hypothetical protein
MEKTSMQQLLEYIKTANTFTFLPEQLAKTIEDIYLEKSRREIRDAFNNGEMNVWNRDRDGHIFEYEGGEDYFNKEYKLNEIEVDEELIALIKENYAEELEQDRQAENQIEEEKINKF